MFVISNIEASRISIQELYDLHTPQLSTSRGIGLVISNTQVVEIVDLDSSSLKFGRITSLDFENNPFLKLGLINPGARLGTINKTVFGYNGVLMLHDVIFDSRNVFFSNFSHSMSKLMVQKAIPTEQPWSAFAIDHLILEQSLTDIPKFLGLKVLTVTIRNVVSVNNTELIPQYFLNNSYQLEKIIISNSSNATLPKFFFETLYDPIPNKTYNLSMELDIWNVQKQSIGKRGKISPLNKLNQVAINVKLRDILASNDNPNECSLFCQRSNGRKVNCSNLSDNDKRACGICVRNIIGDYNLTQVLVQVCDIKKYSSNTPQTTASQIMESNTTMWPMTTAIQDTAQSQQLTIVTETDDEAKHTTLATGKYH